MIVTFDQKLVETLNNWQVNGWPVGNLLLVIIAIVLSVILCGAIGIEREWRGRSAGLRTHLLVGLGSCVIMIISIYGFPAIFVEEGKRDVARLAAQIITGVGFLGAGAIIHKNDGIKGLTTAGTIWIVMAIGIACGSFNFVIATATSLTVLIVLTIFRKVEARMGEKKMTLAVTAASDEPVLAKLLEISREFNFTVKTLSTDLANDNGKQVIQYMFQLTFHAGSGQSTAFLERVIQEINVIEAHPLNDHR